VSARQVIAVGQRFGSWVVTGRAPKRESSRDRGALWAVRCDCGGTSAVEARDLNAGRTSSCRPCGYTRRRLARANA
jgi:hypothetical protein